MEYVFLSVGLIVLVILILAFRPTHRESAMRGAMNAQRVFETELLSDSEIEIVSRYLPREQMEMAGYVK